MKHTTLAIMAAALMALVVLAGCSSGQQAVPTSQAAAQGKQTIKIGISLPLTGEAASIGDSIAGGADLAMQEVNDAGGVNGRLIELIYEDDKCDKGGVTAITKLANVDEVDGIIGPVCSAAAGPGLPVAQEAGVPVIVFASAPHLTQLGDYIYRIYPSDAFAGKFLAEYAYNTLEARNVAVVYVQNDWGQGIRDTFKESFSDLGGEVVFDDSLLQTANDARTLLTKLKAKDPEAIIAPLYPAAGLVFVKQAREMELDVPILGGDAFETSDFIESGFTDDVIYITASLNQPDEFKEKLEEMDRPVTAFAPLGYDAVKIYAKIMEEVGTDKVAVRDALQTLSYQGISTSTIEFDENGDLTTASYDVKVIKDKQALTLR